MVESFASELARSGGGADGDPHSLSPESLARGGRLGRYELLVPVAVGGMAQVWAARLQGQLGFTKLVAIKTVLPHLSSDPEFSHMLADEAKIASGAGHPNVVEIYELGEERGVVYIAMEWVYGDSLSEILRAPAGSATPLDARIAARIIADAAAGLHAAHELKDEGGRALHVVHRDVSPHNILVSADGNVKVTDFGVAKLVGAAHQPTSVGQLKGKVSYMAPEQANGAGVDRRSDVFSLGCVLYEATTGKRPFRGEGDYEIVKSVVKGSFVPPTREATGYPGDLEAIVLRAMAAEPADRYQSMDEMRSALEEWLAHGGKATTPANVGVVIRERIGAEVEKRREQIRLATNPSDGAVRASAAPRTSEPPPRRTDPPKVTRADARTSYRPVALPTPVVPFAPSFPATPIVSSLPPVVEVAPRVPSKTDYMMAASLGVIAAAALGAASFWVYSSMQSRPAASAVVATAPAAITTEEIAARAPSPPPTGTTAVPLPPITFKVSPADAVIVVNGSALPSSVRSIPRPAAGALENVTVHADGFDDQTVTVDDGSLAIVEVSLDPATKGSKAGAREERAPTSAPSPH